MSLIKKLKTKIFKDLEEEEIKNMNEILDRCNQIYKEERIEGISLFYQANSIYRKMLNEKGKIYCERKLSQEIKKINEISEKIIDYTS